MKHLTLVIPSLLPELSEMSLPGFPEPQAPALQRLLNRSQTQVGIQGFYATLCQLLQWPKTMDCPIAALAMANTHPKKDYWLCASPVHLRPDRDGLVLFESSQLQIRGEEAQALVEAFNSFYQADNLRLHLVSATQWYLQLPDDPQIKTSPLYDVVKKDIRGYLPVGEGELLWRQRLNEIQMLMYNQACNQRREMNGEPAVNSLWLWGGGGLSVDTLTKSKWQSISGKEPILSGLAHLAQASIQALPSEVAVWLKSLSTGDHLVVLDDCQLPVAYDDVDSWLQSVTKLERDWFQYVLKALQLKQLDSVTLYICNGVSYCIKYRQLKRFWLRQKPILNYCTSF